MKRTIAISVSLATILYVFPESALTAPGSMQRVEMPYFAEDDEIPEEIRVLAFNSAWETIRDNYYDPSFNGVDWEGVRGSYEEKILSASKSGDFHSLLAKMLHELEGSHLAVVPPHSLKRNRPQVPRKTIAGVELRLSGGSIAVYSVEPGTPAYLSGLRPGHVVLKIDGMAAGAIERDENDAPTLPVDSIKKARSSLAGDPETSVCLEVRDGKGKERIINIPRTAIPSRRSSDLVDGTFEARELIPGILYVDFSAWTFSLMTKLESVIDRIHESKGLIIDLRQNPGGVNTGADYLASVLFRDDGLFGTEIGRNGERTAWTFSGGGDEAYQGKVTILIDEGTGSTSEVFAAALQESGRAVVIGRRTSGQVLPATQFPLPSGGVMMYPHSDFITPGGQRLESRGVIPDIVADPEVKDLLEGKDSVIETAARLMLD